MNELPPGHELLDRPILDHCYYDVKESVTLIVVTDWVARLPSLTDYGGEQKQPSA
jgi:hypothetical protein